MQLILIQCAGQLGDALLVELVQAVVQLVSAVIQLACALVQGVHAIVQGLSTGGKLCAAVLGRVCTVCGGLHTGGVLTHAGNKELDLGKAVLQGTHIRDILTVLYLILQLCLGGVLGFLTGQQLHQTAQHGGVVVLHQAQSGLQIVVRLGSGKVQRQIQLAVLEAGSLLPDGAHHLAASGSQRLVVDGQDVVDDRSVVIPGHVGVDQAALFQGLVGRSQHAVSHLLCTAVQGAVVGAQGVQTGGQLPQTLVQSGCTIVQGVSAVQQCQHTAGQLTGTVLQLRSAVQQLAHGVVQLVDAVGQVVEAAQVKHIVSAQSRSAGGAGHHHLRAGQFSDIRFHRDGVLQIVLDGIQLVRQQTGQGVLHARQGDKGSHIALGGAFHQTVGSHHVSGILPEDHAHSGDQRGDDGAVGAVHIHGAGLVILQGDGHGQMAALADQILQCGFLTVQCVGDGSLNGQGAVRVTLIIHIGIIGVPHQLFAVLCKRGTALGVLDVGQGALVGHLGQTGGTVNVLADGGALDGAIGVHHRVYGLRLGKAAAAGGKSRGCTAGGEGNCQRRTGETKRFFHNALLLFRLLGVGRFRHHPFQGGVADEPVTQHQGGGQHH